MKFDISTSFTLFLFVKIMVSPSLIFAWTLSNPPERPQNDNPRTCAQWIEFNGFTLDNYNTNRTIAMERDNTLDKQASTWAAMYAFKISGSEELNRTLPYDFCEGFGYENRVSHRFVALEEEFRSCENWIKFYSFSERDYEYNLTYSMNIIPNDVTTISLWAHSYWILIWFYETEVPFSPREFCTIIGKSVGEQAGLMPFMCENETLMTCMAWIELYDYTDVPFNNLMKAHILRMNSFVYPIHIHYFPSNYAKKLERLWKQNRPVDHMTPLKFCRRFHGNGDEPQRYSFSYAGELQ